MSYPLFWLFTAVSFFSHGQAWVRLPDLPGQGRDDGVAAVVNNKAYFGSGLREGTGLGDDFHELNLATQTWGPVAPLPVGAQRQYASSFHTLAGFFIVAGEQPDGLTTGMYKYEAGNNTWVSKAPKPGNGILGMCCFEFGNKVVFAGGRLGDGSLSHEVWEYDIAGNSWTQKNNVPFGGRWRACGTVWNNTGYLLFGMDDDDVFRNEMYSYDPGTDTWTEITEFPGNGRTYATMQTVSNRLVIFAGIDSLSNYYNDLWFFDPVWGVWSTGPSMPAAARKGGMSVTANGKFYYSCGIRADDSRLGETWMLDLPTAIAEAEKSGDFLMYPNPVKERLNVRCKPPLKEIALIDISGRQIPVEMTNSDDSQFQTDLTGLPAGVYILKAESSEGTVYRKLVKE